MADQKPNIYVRQPVSSGRYWTDNKFIDEKYMARLGKGASVYSVMLRHVDNKTQRCFLSYETLMEEAGIGSRATLSATIKKLQELNMVKPVRNSLRKCPDYYMVDRLDWKLPSSTESGTTRVVPKVNSESYQKLSPSSTETGTLRKPIEGALLKEGIDIKEIEEKRRALVDKMRRRSE